MTTFNKILIAHRGESFDAPENTLAAINLAWKRGAKAVEIDIRLTADNEIVVIHDKDTLRITGVKKIIDSTPLKELKLLNAGFHKKGNWNNVRIPTLSEVLKTIPSDGRLIIEIKSNDSILAKLTYELSQSNKNPNQIEIIAFDLRTLAKAKELLPQFRMLWLLNFDYILPSWFVVVNNENIIKKLNKLNINGVSVWAGKLLTSSFISEFKEAGLFVYTWTVDDLEKAKIIINDGIDGLTTNRAGWMKNKLNEL